LCDLPPTNLDRGSWKILVLAVLAGGGFSMKRSRFSDQQIAFVLRQADEGTAIAEGLPQSGDQ
jgi:hypothetical protein